MTILRNPKNMIDNYGREISYLRISLTDRCNLRCKYCMPEEGAILKEHIDMLSLEEIEEIVAAAAKLGINKIRLTGGEPLLKRGLLSLCEKISNTPGITDLAITTNGVLLEEMAESLKNAGVKRLNISLDTLDPNRYSSITRGGKIADVLGGISKALNCGFEKMKINTVLLGGFNEDEIESIAKLTLSENIDVRFIELMHMPHIYMPSGAYIPNSTVLEKLPELIPCAMDGVAKMYRLPDGIGRIGLISPVSCSFCESCNRIRLTADGMIKPCLHSKEELCIKGLHDETLIEGLKNAILSKPEKHLELDAENSSKSIRDMNKIGG